MYIYSYIYHIHRLLYIYMYIYILYWVLFGPSMEEMTMSTTNRCRLVSVVCAYVLHQDSHEVTSCGQARYSFRYVCCAVHMLYQAYLPEFAPKQAARGLSADDLQTQYGSSLTTPPLADASSPFLLHKALTQRLTRLTSGYIG